MKSSCSINNQPYKCSNLLLRHANCSTGDAVKYHSRQTNIYSLSFSESNALVLPEIKSKLKPDKVYGIPKLFQFPVQKFMDYIQVPWLVAECKPLLLSYKEYPGLINAEIEEVGDLSVTFNLYHFCFSNKNYRYKVAVVQAAACRIHDEVLEFVKESPRKITT